MVSDRKMGNGTQVIDWGNILTIVKQNDLLWSTFELLCEGCQNLIESGVLMKLKRSLLRYIIASCYMIGHADGNFRCLACITLVGTVEGGA